MNQLVRNLRVSTFSLSPLTPGIGAEVGDLDLSKPLDGETRDGLRQALRDWKVLFFRDQAITTEQHLAFARNFGDLEVHPFAPSKPGDPEVMTITHNKDDRGQENTWHSDVTWREAPSLGSILRCLECPPVGGDTLFADMYAAYDGLKDDVKDAIEGRFAVHDFAHFRRGLRKQGKSEAEIDAFNKAYPMVQHPIVRTHPDTGRKALYVNAAFTQSVVGMEAAQSEALLKHLYAQAAIPEYQCRFRWEADSVAFWDNRASQHYAVSDYWPAVRRMERVTIVGDRPV
ncbi:TauD/TfdA family dioxygenase [Phenylobacterium sp.]|uniref:TauD/TfdA dioxygenase family protein n=1 Tax=Phenylobacterium sp. TaxID=1871053 RepID=UPI00120AB27F|nr:TauD/TfdA family dioxygenase [Phenylobacterium sp.]THD68550.1 MAG: taurine dioxygenase [Phenylobacterium sp.]